MIAARLGVLLLLAAVWAFALSGNLASPHTRPAAAGAELRGDADCSGTVGPNDLREIMAAASGIAGGGCAATLGDADCSGQLQTLDALRLAYHLIGMTAATACPIGEPVTGEPSSFQLIDAAVTAGTISAETGILYKAFAAFNDDRLPGEYEGASQDIEPPDEIWFRPDGLSPDTTAILDSYLLPPAEPGSWYEQQGLGSTGFGGGAVQPAGATATPPPGQWQKVQPASARLNIWWDTARPADQARANTLAADVDMLWDKYQDLLGVQPLGDGTPPHHGPDAKYDIYLSPLGAGFYGYVSAYASTPAGTAGCPSRPSFMVINNTIADATKLRGTLAHEMFHVFQFSRNYEESCLSGSWLMEASAGWAEHYAFPNFNTEHSLYGYARAHYQNIQAWYAGGYGAYAYLWYLTQLGSD